MLIAAALLCALLLHAPAAYGAAGDPSTGSPAGAVYVLPLEQGRSDAAPKGGLLLPGAGGGGGGPGGGAGGGGESLYRSENNFGSSSRVPGLAAVGAGIAAGAAAGGKGAGAAGNGSASGGGAGGTAPASSGAGSAAEVAAAERVADSGNTSVSASIALLAAIGLAAIAVGTLSARAARHGHAA